MWILILVSNIFLCVLERSLEIDLEKMDSESFIILAFGDFFLLLHNLEDIDRFLGGEI
jgi:hypothetical protein